MNELQSYLNSYLGIPDHDMAAVQSLFKEKELLKGDFFCKSEQYCDKLSFIKSGYVRIFAQEGTKEITQWISSPGYFLTDLGSFIFDQRARWNMQALEDCRLFTIHKKDFRKLGELVSNWSQLENRFLSSCFIMLENRVFSHLSLNAEERYRKLYEADRTLFQKVPQQYLASMLGMSPETFSRIRAKIVS